MNKKIFIAIPSAGEKYLRQTILTAIKNAKDPSRLTFGIVQHCIQNDKINMIPEDLSDISKNIYTSSIFSKYQINLGYLRNAAILLNKDKQDFYLQVDAHMIFLNNWDEDLINYYENLLTSYQKPIISGKVPAWYSKNDEIYLMDDDQNDLKLNPYEMSNNFNEIGMAPMKMHDEDFIFKYADFYGKEENGLAMSWGFSTIGYDRKKNVEEHGLFNGSLLFFKFEFLEELMPDPLILFSQDEILPALRAVSRKYQIFAINKTIAISQNKYQTIGLKSKITTDKHIMKNNLFKQDWRLFVDKNVPDNYNPFLHNKNSEIRSINLIIGKELNFWGAKTQEDLNLFYDKIGFRFDDCYNNYMRHLKNMTKQQN